ncbi:MAG: tRNA-specific adenosine deaminase, partial [Gammaproteobacteria bacterium]|nr:tRNA-specific adenosine deaminase [Gammaproteobacteria bacterium]
PMCAGAIIHARVEKVVFAATDPRSGAAGSVFDLLPSDERFNHCTSIESGLLADESSTLLKAFFRKKRQNRSD